MRVLAVDDDRVLLRYLESALESAGHMVETAESGEAAYRAYVAEPAHVVVTDWMMPGMSGHELVQRIRASDLGRYTYIMMLTGRDTPDDVLEGLAAGADDYLTKPFDPRELVARVAIGERIVNLEDRLRRSADELREVSGRDPVTGVFNARTLRALAGAELARSADLGSPVSIALIAIEQLDQARSQHGRFAGDIVLRLAADAVVAAAPDYCWTGRFEAEEVLGISWGREEFLQVLPGQHLAAATASGERLRAAIGALELTLPDASRLAPTASVGLATSSATDGHSLDALLAQAEEALRRARADGGNCVRTARGAGADGSAAA
jgi:diguanylate cyclase (GGDEF)-like protein